ncbi:MAG: MATE family efflux transporter [Butyrivibrio sp.]|uniref:MATE family efflux transporter n=1 Tax=Butyrivibrio sp. NC2002 TaxID=1410610 RepID=UPI00056CB193|nr:MATE family efflux transporter [Butyrivibrio sp. NC2002]MBE5858751.1 MATE family efflux transporter [Butyrivibrio sp.]
MRDPLAAIRNGEKLTTKNEIGLILRLSLPAILAQISSIIMQYIDASMVGRLGANSSAAIGLVSSTTWLIGGIISAVSVGFTVCVAHKIGAKDEEGARVIVKWGLICSLVFSLIISAIAVSVSSFLPAWMGGAVEIRKEATAYFLVYALTVPVQEMLYVSQGMIQSGGNIRVPSILSVIMCALDVLFNALLIPVLGVVGAALGTSISIFLIAMIMMYILLFKSSMLRIFRRKIKRRVRFSDFAQNELPRALRIAIPVAIDNIIMGFAYVAFTRIISPFGTVSVAANSFSITAESLCYMPGYGIGVAATTVVGQCIGARRKDLGKRLGWIAVALGMGVMSANAVLMWIFAPVMIGILSPDAQIRALGTSILRIEAFAEPLYGASIVAAGVFRGAGETMLSSVLNLLSVWMVRIPLAALLGSKYGLKGAWIAMCTELCVRGILFLIRLIKWK